MGFHLFASYDLLLFLSRYLHPLGPTTGCIAWHQYLDSVVVLASTTREQLEQGSERAATCELEGWKREEASCAGE